MPPSPPSIARDNDSFPKRAHPISDDGFAQGSLNAPRASSPCIASLSHTSLPSGLSTTTPGFAWVSQSSMQRGVHFQGDERSQVEVGHEGGGGGGGGRRTRA